MVCESEFLVKIAGFLSMGRKGARSAKAAAFFPFVFVRAEKYATPMFLNHENIHFRQQLETLFIGALLLQIVEDVYSRLFLRLKAPEYYLYRAMEQEAYRNQHDFSYLQNRRLFSLFKYFKDKRQLNFVPGSEPEVIIGESL